MASSDASAWVRGSEPRRTKYPFALDSARDLFSVADGAVSKLLADWSPEDSEMLLDPSSLGTALFPDSGFVTLYATEGSEATPASDRSVTLAYSGADGTRLTGVSLASFGPASKRGFKAGSAVVLNVMAEHREAVRSAVLAIERRVGCLRCPNPGSLEHLVRRLSRAAAKPRPWFEVYPKAGSVGTKFRFSDRTTGIRPRDLNIEMSWDFGDGATSREASPEHSYAEPGDYTVTLGVKTDSGEGTVSLVRCLRVIGPPPLPAEVSVDPIGAFAGETEVSVSVERSPSPTGDQIVSHAWEFGESFGVTLPSVPAFRIVPARGGVFFPRVKRTTASGAYSWDVSPAVLNVVERSSAWVVSSPTSRNSGVKIDEFVPSSAVWKVIQRPLGVRRALASFPSQDPAEAREETWATDGALVRDAESSFLRYLYSASDRQMRWEVCDSLTGSWTSGDGARYVGWGWRAARAAADGVPADLSAKTFVFFGSLTPEGGDSLESTTVNELDGETGSWRVHALPIQAEVTIRSVSSESSGGRPRWRVCGWEDHFYMMRSPSKSSAFTRMFRYYPLTKTWEDAGEQKWSGTALDVRQGELVGMARSLFFFCHRRRSYGYAPRRGLWFVTDFAPQWTDTSLASELDQDRIVLASAGHAGGAVENHLAYALSPYSPRATGEFDEVSGLARAIGERPSGHAWALGRS